MSTSSYHISSGLKFVFLSQVNKYPGAWIAAVGCRILTIVIISNIDSNIDAIFPSVLPSNLLYS